MTQSSWEAIDEKTIVKALDFSSFNCKFNPIPKKFHYFFAIGTEHKDITLVERSREFNISIKCVERQGGPLMLRLQYGKDLSKRLRERFPNWVNIKQRDKVLNMKLVFEQTPNPQIFNIALEDKLNLMSFDHAESELSINYLETRVAEHLPENYESTGRTKIEIDRLDRSTTLRERIKNMYEYRCQVCQVFLKKPGGAIAECAHIKGLGEPHNGPDVLENMLCLCPNHHDSYDALSFYIDPDTLFVHGIEKYEGKKINIALGHTLNRGFLRYHEERYHEANNN